MCRGCHLAPWLSRILSLPHFLPSLDNHSCTPIFLSIEEQWGPGSVFFVVLMALCMKKGVKMDTSNQDTPSSKRLFFPDLWRLHRFRVDLIAPLAQVPEEVIDAMLCNAPVTSAQATRVLAALSRVLKQEYTLDTVFVPILAEGDEDAAEKELLP